MPALMMDDPITPQTLDDFEPEPNDHADAVFDEASEIAGLHVRLLIGITEFAYSHADDKDALDALKTVFHWNPKHLIRAYERFPGVYDLEYVDTVSWEEVVATWTLGRIKDDETASTLYNNYRANTWDLAQLRDAVKAANGTRGRKPSEWEQVAELVKFQRSVGGYKDGDRIFNIIETLAAIHSVAKALEAQP